MARLAAPDDRLAASSNLGIRLMEEIAQVYSRSLFEVAKEQDKLDAIRDQLGEFTDALSDNRDLQVFLFSPYFSTVEKKEGLRKVLDGADPAFQNFLDLLVEKHRMPALFRIRRQFEERWQEENRLLPVQVTSAIELDDETVEQISSRIAEQTDRRIELTTDVNPEILGGIVLRVGNSILDASIRNRLEQVRRQLARA
jgi:F-type H+-transporting ATPase subunit delta